MSESANLWVRMATPASSCKHCGRRNRRSLLACPDVRNLLLPADARSQSPSEPALWLARGFWRSQPPAQGGSDIWCLTALALRPPAQLRDRSDLNAASTRTSTSSIEVAASLMTALGSIRESSSRNC